MTSKKYTLEPRVDMLCADFSDKENPVAVVKIHVLVTTFDASCSCVKTRTRKTFSAQTPLPVKPAAAQVVEGLSVSPCPKFFKNLKTVIKYFVII